MTIPRRIRRLPRFDAAAELRRTVGVEEASRRLLLYFVVPIWVAAGFADWLCHRRTNIESTAGLHESIVHAVQMSQGGAPALMGLFLEVNAGVLATAYAALGLHQATAAWDVAYADGLREVTPTEQHVHGLLEQVPMMASAFLTALHWDQACALFRLGDERPDFSLRRKRRPLSRRYVSGVLGAIAALVVVPYAEELWRCARRDATVRPHDQPLQAAADSTTASG